MKRRIAWLAAIVLIVSSATSIAQAATPDVKQGDNCTKLGKTIVQNGIKFFCIKKSNKLIWNKGVEFKEPVRIIKYPDAPTSFDDLIANYKGISYAAWSKSSAAITAATDSAPTFKAVTKYRLSI